MIRLKGRQVLGNLFILLSLMTATTQDFGRLRSSYTDYKVILDLDYHHRARNLIGQLSRDQSPVNTGQTLRGHKFRSKHFYILRNTNICFGRKWILIILLLNC